MCCIKTTHVVELDELEKEQSPRQYYLQVDFLQIVPDRELKSSLCYIQ